jgi:adenosine deaminase
VHVRTFIAALPKAELHLHLMGSASVDTVLALARRRPDSPVPTDRDELTRFYAFRDFAHLAQAGTPLEVCVTSNMRTNVVPRLADHPVRALLAAGVTVVPATDDPGMFGTDLNTEYERVAEIAGLDTGGLAALARAGVDSSFAPASLKASMRDEIDALAGGAHGPAAGPVP